MLKLMNVATISERTFYHHTSSYLNAVVIQQWKERQQDLISEFLEKNDWQVMGAATPLGTLPTEGQQSSRFSAGSGLKLSHVMVESFKAMG